jgi:hypothetical protein
VAIATYIFTNGKSDVNKRRRSSGKSSQMWQERRSSGKRGKSELTWQDDVNVARATLSGNMNFFFYKFPLFCDNMDNFVHNAANKTSAYGIQPFKDEVLCDVSPLDVCDVLLGQPYMWKHHAIYESRPRSVIVTLGVISTGYQR